MAEPEVIAAQIWEQFTTLLGTELWRGDRLKAYVGLEPSGFVHLGNGRSSLGS